jgi:xylitol oxidase
LPKGASTEGASTEGANTELTNWAGNVVFVASEVHRPESVAELQAVVARGARIRALGTGHSFSRMADTPGMLVATADLPPVMDIDSGQATVTVGAGVRYGDLARHLHAAGFALPNLASLPHISVAGACATATHGSGSSIGNLATAVSALEMVTADGDLVTLTRVDERFPGAVVSLGSLGIVTTLTLDLVPTFEVRQYVYEGLPAAELDKHFDDIMASAYSVSVFTDWRGERHRQIWLKQRTSDPVTWDPGHDWRGARPASGPVNPVPGMDPANSTEQMGVPGPWHERLPHFRLEFTPSAGDELQAEYLLPRHAARSAMAAVAALGHRLAPVLQITEIRTVAADQIWLSPSFQRDTVGLHFTLVRDPAAVAPVLAAIEGELTPLGARPHWGKLQFMPPDTVRGQYPHGDRFEALLREFDPAGKFRNDFVDTYFPPG